MKQECPKLLKTYQSLAVTLFLRLDSCAIANLEKGNAGVRIPRLNPAMSIPSGCKSAGDDTRSQPA